MKSQVGPTHSSYLRFFWYVEHVEYVDSLWNTQNMQIGLPPSVLCSCRRLTAAVDMLHAALLRHWICFEWNNTHYCMMRDCICVDHWQIGHYGWEIIFPQPWHSVPTARLSIPCCPQTQNLLGWPQAQISSEPLQSAPSSKYFWADPLTFWNNRILCWFLHPHSC